MTYFPKPRIANSMISTARTGVPLRRARAFRLRDGKEVKERPVERRREVSQFLTGANYGLAAGNFELDFEDGEIRYKTVLHSQGSGIDRTILKRLVRSNGMAMETYLPGIGAVITGTPALPALERRTPR